MVCSGSTVTVSVVPAAHAGADEPLGAPWTSAPPQAIGPRQRSAAAVGELDLRPAPAPVRPRLRDHRDVRPLTGDAPEVIGVDRQRAARAGRPASRAGSTSSSTESRCRASGRCDPIHWNVTRNLYVAGAARLTTGWLTIHTSPARCPSVGSVRRHPAAEALRVHDHETRDGPSSGAAARTSSASSTSRSPAASRPGSRSRAPAGRGPSGTRASAADRSVRRRGRAGRGRARERDAPRDARQRPTHDTTISRNACMAT